MMQRSLTTSQASQKGFSILEMLLATVILLGGLVAIPRTLILSRAATFSCLTGRRPSTSRPQSPAITSPSRTRLIPVAQPTTFDGRSLLPETALRFPRNGLFLVCDKWAATVFSSRSHLIPRWENEFSRQRQAPTRIHTDRIARRPGYIFGDHRSGVHSAKRFPAPLPDRVSSADIFSGSAAGFGPDGSRY